MLIVKNIEMKAIYIILYFVLHDSYFTINDDDFVGNGCLVIVFDII